VTTAAKPLEGRTILITRTKSQSTEFRRRLEAAGARVLEVPAIEIRPRMSPQLDDAIDRFEDYDWLFFTSANAVEIFADRIAHLRPDFRPGDLKRPKLCAIGPATSQKIQDYGYPVSLVPAVFQAEGVIEELTRYQAGQLEGVKILLPRAAQAREILPQELRRRGAVVDLIPVYDTVLPDRTANTLGQLLRDVSIDLITFTSSSTVHNFVQAAGPEAKLSSWSYAAIGPITAATAKEYGLPIAVMPGNWTVPDLAQAIVEYFTKDTDEHGRTRTDTDKHRL